MLNLSVTTKSINSKSLFQEIDKVVRDGMFSVDLSWQDEENREIFVSFLNSVMHEYYENGVIEQWKILCNNLNNNVEDMLQGKVDVDIYFKQRNCLNTSRITYSILE